MATNVFVSYSDEDKQKIFPILNSLRAIEDVKIFFAEEAINPGSEVSTTIANAIKECHLFLVFYSKAAIKSCYVQQEIGLAKANNKIIIPILLDSTKPNAMLAGFNYVDLSKPERIQNEFNRLYSFINLNIKQQQQGQIIAILALVALGCLYIYVKKNA